MDMLVIFKVIVLVVTLFLAFTAINKILKNAQYRQAIVVKTTHYDSWEKESDKIIRQSTIQVGAVIITWLFSFACVIAV